MDKEGQNAQHSGSNHERRDLTRRREGAKRCGGIIGHCGGLQVPVPIQLMGLRFDEGFRADIIVEDILLIELKSVEKLAPVHAKQVLTYLRLLKLPLGLLINFGASTFKEGIQRIVNNHKNFASSRLRVNQTRNPN